MPPRVFLSHNSRDKPAVNAIARRLVEAGVDCWYDAWDLTRGERWLPELQEALRELQACVIFYGPDGLGPWQQMEIEAITYAAGDARRTNRPFHVTPARLPDAPPWRELDLPPFLRERIQVDFPSVADNTAFLQLKLGIEGQASGPPDRLAGGRVPYVGLRPYREEDEGLFYGRDKEVAQLLTLLDKTGAPRFITLLGASGSGKSSLVFGGLLPDLREGKSLPGSKSWLRVTMQPGQIALNSLRDALKGQEPLARHVPVNDEAWQRPDTLQSVAMAALGNTDSNKRLLLVVDQFESLFTQQPAESSALHQYRERILLPFLRNLLHAAREPSGPITILLTARNDFFGTMVEDQWGLSEILDDHHLRLVLRSLEGESLRAVIERPATKLGVDFEEGLVEAVVEDFRIQASGSLPFLQEALVGIWMKRSSGQASASGERRPLLTLQSYIELGRLRGALNAHAEEVWQRVCQQPGLEGPARAILVHLVRLGDGGEPDTKRRVPIGDLPAAEPGRKAARFLAAPNARLLTLDTYGDLAGTATAELSHEALLAGWNRLNDWLNDHHQDGLKLRPDRLKLRRWEVAARLWQVRGEDAPDLLKSREIKAVELLAGKIPDEMPPQLASYLAESRRMRGRNRRNFATVVSLLTLVAVLGTLYIWNRTADSKFVEQLISESRSPGTSRELGFLLADEALKLAKTENHKREADHARLQASLDLGPCEKRFGASYLFGKIVPPELDSSEWRDPFSENPEGMFGTSCSIDASARWVFLKGALGFIRFDLNSRSSDHDARIYYWPAILEQEQQEHYIYHTRIQCSADGAMIAACHMPKNLGSTLMVWREGPLCQVLKGFPEVSEAGILQVHPEGRWISVGGCLWTATPSGDIEEKPRLKGSVNPTLMSRDGRYLCTIEIQGDDEFLPWSSFYDDGSAVAPGDTPRVGEGFAKFIIWDSNKDFDCKSTTTWKVRELEQLLQDHAINLDSVGDREPKSVSLARLRQEFHNRSPKWAVEIRDVEHSSPLFRCRSLQAGLQVKPIEVAVSGHGGFPVALSPDEKWFAAIDQSWMSIWDLSTYSDGQTPQEFSAPGEYLRFSSDSRWLASASNEEGARTIDLWDMRFGTLGKSKLSLDTKGKLYGDDYIHFSQDGRWMICLQNQGSGNGLAALQFWDLAPSRDQRLPGRNFSVEEWRKSRSWDGRLPGGGGSDEMLANALKATNLVVKAHGEFDALTQLEFSEETVVRLLQEVVENLKSAKQLNPSLAFDPELHGGRLAELKIFPVGVDLAQRGYLEEARGVFQIIRRAFPESRVDEESLMYITKQNYVDAAIRHSEDGDVEKAMEEMRRLKKLWPEGEVEVESLLAKILANARIESELKQKARPEAVERVKADLAILMQGPRPRQWEQMHFRLNEIAKWRLRPEGSLTESEARDIVAQFDLSVELERRERLGMDYEDDGQNVDVSYEMCWGIAFAGFPSLVLERCERQFEGSQSGHEIETLGLLRALSGDRAGAAAAFNASLRMAYCSLANDVKESWVAQLRENQNPFTKEVIEELKKQEPDERVLLGE